MEHVQGAVHITPTDRVVEGPLAAASIVWSAWTESRTSRLIYADLDLADRDTTSSALGVGPDVSDEELVLGAFDRWGVDCGMHLGGQFAFALWDAEARRVVAVRDFVGMRPLVYAPTGDGIIVGGDIRAVLATDGVSDEIDTDLVVTCVLWNHVSLLNSWGRTCYQAIDTVRPAHLLVAEPGTCDQRRYWHPENVPRLDLGKPAAYVDALRALLAEVITDLTPTEGVVGSHLSGGLDSSVVTALAARARLAAGAAPPVAFPWQPGPELGRGLEHDRIESVADFYDLPVVYCPATFESQRTEMTWDITQHPSTMLRSELPVRQAARKRGVTTILSGHGGDEAATFNGRGRTVRHLLRRGKFLPVAKLALTEKSGPAQVFRAVFPRQRNQPYGWHIPVEEQRRRTLDGLRPTALHHDVLRRASLVQSSTPPPDQYEVMSWFLGRGHLGTRASDWARAGAAMGINYRYPLLDRRVVEFSMGLPAHLWLQRDGHKRWITRAAVEGWVPDPARLSDKSEPIWLAHHVSVGAQMLTGLQVDLSGADPRRAALFDMLPIDADGARHHNAPVYKWLGLPRDSAADC